MTKVTLQLFLRFVTAAVELGCPTSVHSITSIATAFLVPKYQAFQVHLENIQPPRLPIRTLEVFGADDHVVTYQDAAGLSGCIVLFYFSSELRFAFRSPCTQCFVIHGCCWTSSKGSLFSGSSTNNFLMRSLASGLTKAGTVMSHLAIFLCVWI